MNEYRNTDWEEKHPQLRQPKTEQKRRAVWMIWVCSENFLVQTQPKQCTKHICRACSVPETQPKEKQTSLVTIEKLKKMGDKRRGGWWLAIHKCCVKWHLYHLCALNALSRLKWHQLQCFDGRIRVIQYREIGWENLDLKPTVGFLFSPRQHKYTTADDILAPSAKF